MNLRKNFLYASGITVAAAAFSCNIGIENRIQNINETESAATLTREDIIVPISDVMDFYIDCNQKIYDPKRRRYTARDKSKIGKVVEQRRELEKKWTTFYNEQIGAGKTLGPLLDTNPEWYDPLGGYGWFTNSFKFARPREGGRIERHGAIDMFAPEGTKIYSPVNGIVIASADNWNGSWTKYKGFNYVKGTGLGKLPGNGVVIFNPENKSYHFMVHFDSVYVRTGEVLFRGDLIGTVGRTGNASSPWSKPHLHLAFKESGTGCNLEGVLVAKNPHEKLTGARDFILALKNPRVTVDVE